jgi:hypothetical protein
MSANDARVHKVQVPVEQACRIGLRLQGLQHPLPEPGLTPALELFPVRLDHRRHSLRL